MISIEQALEQIMARLPECRSTWCALDNALGHVLAEDVQSDIDSPPYDKSLVDGYAVIADDITLDITLSVLEDVLAGQIPTQTIQPGTAIQIMTGAPLPEGASAVVMIEQTSRNQQDVTIHQETIKSETNIMRQATSLSKGETVLSAGKFIRPIEVGILAEIGCTKVPVYQQPKLAIISTGDELVEATKTPQAGQIRNSNGPLLQALATSHGADAHSLGIGVDNFEALSDLVATGLESDILILSGGVSAGVKDLVPAVLRQHGVEQVFHKLNLKPGKPLWFGIFSSGKHQTMVFGLPGNPVSSLVCFLLFVAPVISKLTGKTSACLRETTASLKTDFQQRGDRPTYFPAQLTEHGGNRYVTPLAWKGSADQQTLSKANALAFFQAGNQLYQTGEEITVFEIPS
ncbi:MAG: molybdenum cofactor biosynthesis protein [Planctomycetaceae bacterium]|nr:molybdenum cofactor biosynthesis protein [Planctomycetaceae bacterium]|tara:strand:- start:1511 stop:2719 length:1209 start_codon:yes stop_codon:yes gene_type:complete